MKVKTRMTYLKTAVAVLSVLSLTACGWPGGNNNSNSGSNSGSGSTQQTGVLTTSIVPYSDSSVYTADTDGSRYVAVKVSYAASAGAAPVTITGTPAFSSDQTGPAAIVADTDSLIPGTDGVVTGTAVYNGLTQCVQGTSLSPGQSCYVFVHAALGTPGLFNTVGAYNQSLTINTSLSNQAVQTVTFHTTPYIYVAGIFSAIDGVSVPSGDLLAKCSVASFGTGSHPILSCQNALPDKQSADASLFRLAFNDAGKLYVGGDFRNIGTVGLKDAPAGATMLASCGPTNADTSETGGSALVCTNALTGDKPYANNDIGAIAIGPNNTVYVGGAFTEIADAAAVQPTTGKNYLIASCNMVNGACTDALNPESSISPLEPKIYPNNHVLAITHDANGKIYFGGWFNEIVDQEGNVIASSTNDLLAQCTLHDASRADCSNLLQSATPNGAVGPILGLTTTNAFANEENVVVAGSFNAIAGISVPNDSHGDPMAMVASCDKTGHCVNAIGNGNGSVGYTDPSNHYINEIYTVKTPSASQSDFFAGGTFIKLGNATQLESGHHMLAHCNYDTSAGAGGDCTNALGDAVSNPNNYANHRIDSIQANVEITATVNSGS